ncbi:helix-turn-helix domain-containing protein [Mucilaginibacter endophyticus]|uniref:helix-turn-helix domain-containing protein n=1 Tax=Mucilaginibacter endophyticus TaxID=2675003 RepID=UPI000E0DDB21|nr:helix-turn-helix domain-containing protein [Mucilaginibacter endophyticus]
MKNTHSARMLSVVRERRLALGFSQEYMAAKLGMKQNTYSKTELGLNQLSIDRLFSICNLLGLAAEDLLGERKDKGSDFSKFFYLNSQPMWLFDPLSLAFLEVNQAAVQNYGYSYEDFKKMTLLDIRPKEKRNWLRAEAGRLDLQRPYYNTSLHQHRDGTIREVLINCYPVSHEHGPAYLVLPGPAPQVRGEASRLQQGIFEQDKLRNAGNGRSRSQFAELRFLTGQLDGSLPAAVQETLVAEIKVLLAQLKAE